VVLTLLPKKGDLQTYCVRGRLISDNVILIQDILDVSVSLGLKTGLISIDQEKAFEHHYLWQNLETFGAIQHQLGGLRLSNVFNGSLQCLS